MNNKCLVFFILLSFLCLAAQSQNISKAVFHLSDTELKSVELTEGSIVFNIDNKGNLISFSSVVGGEYDYFASGYGSGDGKVKSIGNIHIDYWTNDVEGGKDGKLKLIGSLKVDYWTTDLLSGKKGRLKSIGNINVDYFNNDLLTGGQGKLKSIGNINIEYWSGDLLSGKQGKVKSIGNITVDYWSDDLLSSNHGRIKSISGNSTAVYAVRD
jgi:hypothetical protein